MSETIEDQDIRDADHAFDELIDHTWRDCRFSDCSFEETRFVRCRFIGCSFTRCNFATAVVAGAEMAGVVFDNCRLSGIDWTGIQMPRVRLHVPVRFSACLLDYGSFFEMDLTDTHLRDCSARSVDFRGTILRRADLSGTDFDRAEFLDTDLQEADLRGARRYHIDLARCRGRGMHVSLDEAPALLAALGVVLD